MGATATVVGVGEVVPAHVAGADEHDVADAGGGALVFEGFVDFRDGNFVATGGGGWVAVFVLIPAELRSRIGKWLYHWIVLTECWAYPVHEDSTTHDAAAFTPICSSLGRLALTSVFKLGSLCIPLVCDFVASSCERPL